MGMSPVRALQPQSHQSQRRRKRPTLNLALCSLVILGLLCFYNAARIQSEIKFNSTDDYQQHHKSEYGILKRVKGDRFPTSTSNSNNAVEEESESRTSTRSLPSSIEDTIMIVSADNGYCFDLPNSESKSGTEIILSVCNYNQLSQFWRMDNSSLVIQSHVDKGKCIQVQGFKYESGSKIEIQDCYNSGDDDDANANAQRWDFTTAGEIKSKGNSIFCIDGNDVGEAIHLWSCDGGTDQRWNFHKGAIVPTTVLTTYNETTNCENATSEIPENTTSIIIPVGNKNNNNTGFLTFEQFWNQSNDLFKSQRASYRKHTPPPEHKWLLRGNSHHDQKYKLNTDTAIRTDAYNNNENNNTTYTTTTSNNTIPKIIHKVYVEKSGMFPSQNSMTSSGAGSLMDAHNSWMVHNPGYKIKYYNLNLCRQYLHEHFHPVFLRAFDCIEAFSGKVNLFRMMVVYKEGGWYSDWKQVSLQNGLLDTLGKDVDFYGAWDYGHIGVINDKCIQNCFFGAIPRHPLVTKIIQMILANVQKEHYEKHALFSSGPCLLGRAYQSYLKDINCKQGGYVPRVRFGYYMYNYIKTLPDIVRGEQISSHPDAKTIVKHKCDHCGSDQNWDQGNNYNTQFEKKEYYCEDAKALFSTAIANFDVE